MNGEKILKRGGPLFVLAAVAALAIIPAGGAGASPTATSSACKQAKNVEAIIDDSGSMNSEDPGKFRTQLLSAFANIGVNNGLLFGGVEFGNAVNELFGPAKIPAGNVAMQNSFIQVDANNGGTNFDLAFSGANGHNGTADARIFLTDGLAAAPNSHKSPPTKTYVVGLGTIVTDPQAQQVLAQIASDTGGPPPFLVNDASQVQAVAAAITAGVNCKALPLTFTKLFTKKGQLVRYAFKPKGKSADILISWDNLGASIDPLGFLVQLGGGKKSASASSLATLAKKKKAKVKIKKKRGTTFVTVKLKKLRKGKKIKFKVKAKKLSTGPTTVTTQIIR